MYYNSGFSCCSLTWSFFALGCQLQSQFKCSHSGILPFLILVHLLFCILIANGTSSHQTPSLCIHPPLLQLWGEHHQVKRHSNRHSHNSTVGQHHHGSLLTVWLIPRPCYPVQPRSSDNGVCIPHKLDTIINVLVFAVPAGLLFYFIKWNPAHLEV